MPQLESDIQPDVVEFGGEKEYELRSIPANALTNNELEPEDFDDDDSVDGKDSGGGECAEGDNGDRAGETAEAVEWFEVVEVTEDIEMEGVINLGARSPTGGGEEKSLRFPL